MLVKSHLIFLISSINKLYFLNCPSWKFVYRNKRVIEKRNLNSLNSVLGMTSLKFKQGKIS